MVAVPGLSLHGTGSVARPRRPDAGGRVPAVYEVVTDARRDLVRGGGAYPTHVGGDDRPGAWVLSAPLFARGPSGLVALAAQLLCGGILDVAGRRATAADACLAYRRQGALPRLHTNHARIFRVGV